MAKIKCWMARGGVLTRYAHAKLDGIFCRVIRTSDDVRYESSLGNDLYLPDHIIEQCQSLPVGEYLGELWVSNKPSSAVKTAIARQWSELLLTFFAIDDDMLADQPLEEVHAFFELRKLNFAPYEVIANVPVQLTEEELFWYKQRAKDMGIEGWMLKLSNLLGWHKLKIDKTIDLVVIGSIAGEGKYQGLVGSIICCIYLGDGAYLPVANVSSGIDDQTRSELTDRYNELKGGDIVVEVKYQCVDTKGRLRHARFLRLREDKLPEECTIDQDAELEAFLFKSNDDGE